MQEVGVGVRTYVCACVREWERTRLCLIQKSSFNIIIHRFLCLLLHINTYIHIYIYIHRDSLVANEIQKAQSPKTRSSISHNDKRAGTGEGEGDEGEEVTEQDDAAHVSMPGVRRRKNVLKSGE